MKRSWYASPYALWMVLFTVVPLLFVCYYAFTDGSGALTFANFTKIAQPMYLLVLLDSLRLALYCTVLCLLIGYPTAYFLAGRGFNHTQSLVVLILLPMWMNLLLRTYAMMTLLDDNGVLNAALQAIGLGKIKVAFDAKPTRSRYMVGPALGLTGAEEVGVEATYIDAGVVKPYPDVKLRVENGVLYLANTKPAGLTIMMR